MVPYAGRGLHSSIKSSSVILWLVSTAILDKEYILQMAFLLAFLPLLFTAATSSVAEFTYPVHQWLLKLLLPFLSGCHFYLLPKKDHARQCNKCVYFKFLQA